jgi:hypothetical protein
VDFTAVRVARVGSQVVVDVQTNGKWVNVTSLDADAPAATVNAETIVQMERMRDTLHAKALTEGMQPTQTQAQIPNAPHAMGSPRQGRGQGVHP